MTTFPSKTYTALRFGGWSVTGFALLVSMGLLLWLLTGPGS